MADTTSTTSKFRGTKQIDKYVFDHENHIGKGSFSTVYKGFNIETNELVAVKVVDTTIFKNNYHTKLLISEIEALKNLRSEHIVRFYDMKSTKNNVYIFMEFCGDGDLYSLTNGKKLPEAEAKEYLIQLVEAVSYTHLTLPTIYSV
eukprot:TRINITY_DN2487_c0_g1_i5.p1 TRINITY_DN2487_c0_g1~~TRINITY_DN2487_c0_g1_i5.p1  ORF type:complete len:146 (-),score=41.60 TRINITY_DN2487_c0_g1_i5:35-472(-)